MQNKVFNTNEQYKKDPHASNIFTDLGLGSHTVSTMDLITTLFGQSKEELEFEASCDCGILTGNFYNPITRCASCKTHPRTQFCDELSFRGWIDIEGIFGTPVLHPIVYSWLHKWMGVIKRVRVIDALLDVDAILPEGLETLGQGHHYFYRNFWNIIGFFENLKIKRKTYDIRPALNLLGKDIFISNLPILNSSLHIITRHGKMRLADKVSKHIVAALTELSDVVYKNTTSIVNESYIDSQLLSIYRLYQSYTADIAKTKLHSKKGIIRKNLLGGRLHLTFRAVITPIVVPHSMDELHVPWKIGVTILKLEILNILTKRQRYSMEDAIRIHAESIVSYDQRVSDIMDLLILESPHRTLNNEPSISVVFGRNPVLGYLSIFKLEMTVIKKDVNDETICISTTIAKYPNLDFDGDELFGLALKEVHEISLFKSIEPWQGMACTTRGGISMMIRLPQPQLHTLNSFVQSDPCDSAWVKAFNNN